MQQYAGKISSINHFNWAPTWQNQQNGCASSKDSDQPGHPPSLISVFAVRKLGSLATHWAHSEDWSDWVNAQADLGLRWAHTHFVGFVMSWLIYCRNLRCPRTSGSPLVLHVPVHWDFLTMFRIYSCFQQRQVASMTMTVDENLWRDQLI